MATKKEGIGGLVLLTWVWLITIVCAGASVAREFFEQGSVGIASRLWCAIPATLVLLVCVYGKILTEMEEEDARERDKERELDEEREVEII